MYMLNTWVGYVSLFLFTIAYILIIFEEKIHLKKSKPIVLVGCLMWLLIGIYEKKHGVGHGAGAHEFVEHLIAEIGGLFFFLLVYPKGETGGQKIDDCYETWSEKNNGLLHTNYSHRCLFLPFSAPSSFYGYDVWHGISYVYLFLHEKVGYEKIFEKIRIGKRQT
jgi:hypothetical protein